ncbi:ToxD-like protein [Fusarium denticulatum]|uniref:ToxD-like protein n=1 Tax=Fusarium denticulatum TaxID=48507 RepID=A0A8H5TLV3_9HYPO|nr:ToxD-like protein [Fusarium denticulatum]
MRALVLAPKDKHVTVQDIPIPEPGPSEILIRVRAVALNRVDWLYTANPVAAQDYRVVGSDFAGEVAKVGSDLDKVDDPRVKVGTRVASFVQACSVNERPGAFAQYVCVEWDLAWHVADNMSFEEAAGISMCGLTAAQGVFSRLQLPCPFAETEGFGHLGLKSGDPVNILIYGATASLGLFAAQLVRLSEKFSGTKVNLIGVASASKHDLLRAKPYAFDVLIDYHDADWTERVEKLTANTGGVHYGVDAVSVSPTVEQVESVLAPEGRFAVYRSPALGKFDITKLRIKPLIGAVWEGLGVEIGYQGASIPANPKARKFAAEFFKFLGSEAPQGKFKLESNPVRQMPGGLDKIAEQGLPLVSPNKVPGVRAVSAEKVVYTVV